MSRPGQRLLYILHSCIGHFRFFDFLCFFKCETLWNFVKLYETVWNFVWNFHWNFTSFSTSWNFASIAGKLRLHIEGLPNLNKNRTNLKKKSTNFRGFGTERARLSTFRGFGTERARLGTFRGFDKILNSFWEIYFFW